VDDIFGKYGHTVRVNDSLRSSIFTIHNYWQYWYL